MTHADKVREAERAELRAGEEFFRLQGSRHKDQRAMARKWLLRCVGDRLALRAATCSTCGGFGAIVNAPSGHTTPCPAGCDNGRKVGA